MRENYYHLLGISPTASADEVKRAYRKLAKKNHPDISPSPHAAHQFVRITEAYDTLSDPSRRAVYDYKLRRDRRPPVRHSGRPRAAHSPQNAYQAYVRAQNAARDAARRQHNKAAQPKKKASKASSAEANIHHYLQYVLIAALLLIAVAMIAFPFFAMARLRWWTIFAAPILAPVSFKLIAECRKGFNQLKA